jgi:hypothetical protein
MNAKLKTKWLKALRSGKFKQTTGQLRNRGAMCCLGVLAHIQGCEWKRGVPRVEGRQIAENSTSVLTAEFVDIPTDTQQHLASMNDSGQSFREIADFIEKQI